MKSSAIFGILLGFIAIFGSFVWEGGSPATLFLLPAITIVIGGTLAAGLIGSSFDMFRKIPKLLYIAFSSKQLDWLKVLDQIIKFSFIARRNGILSLEEYINKLDNPFMKKIFMVMIDGIDNKNLINIAEYELQSITERHYNNIGLFTKLGGYSPTMGIIGTVMGLIATFASAGSDPNTLIKHIASAFIATLWGIFMANIVWLPIADKLKNLHEEEMRLNNLIINGISSIQMGDTPSVIILKLSAAFPSSKQEEISKRLKRIKEQEMNERSNTQENTESRAQVVGYKVG